MMIRILIYVLFSAIVLFGYGHPLAFLTAAAVHEGGHMVFARLAGVKTRSFSTVFTGMQLTFATEGISYGREAWILAGGSLTGLFSVMLVSPDSAYFPCALGLNLVNLLPINGLDGGGMIRCFLHILLPDGDRADRYCRRLSAAASVLFWTAGMWIVLRAGGSLSWLLCGSAALYRSLDT